MEQNGLGEGNVQPGRDAPNRPPFSSPLSSTEKERKRGEKIQICLTPYRKEN